MKTQFITAQQVGEVMGVSRSRAYEIVRQLNRELKEMGYITAAGKCPLAYFQKKCFGFQYTGEDSYES